MSLYPDQWKYIPIARRWAALRGIPEDLVLGIIAVESGFKPNTYRYESHLKDASYGLMQILEGTARNVGFKKPLVYLRHPLFDPELNIQYGTAFLSQLINRYNNRNDVIAAYNMGFPRRAADTTSAIIRIFGYPKISWTYANQPYVDLVNKNAEYFKALLQGDDKRASKCADEIRAMWAKKYKPVIILPVLGVILYMISRRTTS